MRIYLDSAPVIYTVEQVPHYAAAVDTRLSDRGIVRVASDLTRMECRVKPLRERNLELLKDFDDFFEETVQDIVPLTRHLLDRAAEIRAHYGVKTSDAIHLAAATLSGCDVFLTNDHRLDRFREIRVEVVKSEPP